MDRQILQELVQIKWISFALFVAIVLVIVFFVASVAFKVRSGNSHALLLMRDNFLAELTLLEISGDYDKLLARSDDMMASFPNDLMANWYNAIANHKVGQYSAALSALGRIKSINKSWSAEAVDELMADIRAEMSGPRASN